MLVQGASLDGVRVRQAWALLGNLVFGALKQIFERTKPTTELWMDQVHFAPPEKTWNDINIYIYT